MVLAMEYLTDHLLGLKLTGPGPMSAATEVQHDNFARQLSSFEKLLIISQAKFSLDDLYRNLKLVLKAGNKGMLKIASIESLIECIEIYKDTTKGEEAVQVVEFFDNFVKEVAHLAKVKQFFHNTIYHCLYEFFYDPLEDNSEDEFPQDEVSEDEEEEDKSDIENGTSPIAKSTEPLEEHDTKSTITNNIDVKLDLNIAESVKRKKRKSKKKARLNLLDNVKNKKPKKVDNRLKVLEQIQREKALKEALLANQKLDEPQNGSEFEKLKGKTEKQRLAFAVKTIFSIQDSWTKLIRPGIITTGHFDEDSYRLIKGYKNYLSFEAVFRLIPDILVKGFKLVELSKIWYNCARRLGGTEPVKHQTYTDFFEQITAYDRIIESVEREMHYKRELRMRKQSERKLLVNQILRLDEVKEKYDQCAEKERGLKEYYKQLKSERNGEYPKLDKLERDDPLYKECYDQIQYLAESMKVVYRELRTASYELELVKQDYTVEMGTRVNLIRSQDDIKFTIQDIDSSLLVIEQRKIANQHSCERLRANIARMWTALYRSKADEKLTMQANNILQSKYTQPTPINSRNNTVAISSSPLHNSSCDEAQLDQAIHNTFTGGIDNKSNFERENSDSSEPTASPELLPPPPLQPQSKDDMSEPEKRQRSILNKDYNPSSAGILDKHEAKEYRRRVDRLKRSFELDLSGLKTTVNCDVEAPKHGAPERMESGDEADMDSDQDAFPVRAQSKKFTRRSAGRYSPLSDVSDDYIYQQQVRLPAKTVYILKKSRPKDAPPNRYILKTVPGVKIPPQKTFYSQQKYNNNANHPKPPERQWGNDYESLQALDSQFVNSLSVYKHSPMPGRRIGNSLTPVLPLEHHGGTFAPNLVLSDGDISIDSGTGDSLDSDDNDAKKKKAEMTTTNVNDQVNGYKHKPRVTVRQQFAAAKISQNPSNNAKQVNIKNSRLPKLPSRDPKGNGTWGRDRRFKNALRADSPVKSSPESLESRPIVVKPRLSKPAVRNTLQKKSVQPPPPVKKQHRPVPSDTHPLAPTHLVTINKGVQRKLPFGKLPKSIKQPTLAPRKQGQRARMIESVSDDDIDEIFKQSIARRTLPPKPTVRADLGPPARTKRKYGIRHSLAKAH